MRAINVEEFRAEDYHGVADNGKPDRGGGYMGFNPTDYEGIEELTSMAPTTSLPPPHVKAARIAYHNKQ